MKFEINVEDDRIVVDNSKNIYLWHEGNLVIVSKYMSRILDIIEDIVQNNGKSTLIPYPIEE